MTVSNKLTAKELKSQYSEKANLPQTKYRIRLLYKGQEIKDEHPLYYHNMDNNSKIHVSICELE